MADTAACRARSIDWSRSSVEAALAALLAVADGPRLISLAPSAASEAFEPTARPRAAVLGADARVCCGGRSCCGWVWMGWE